MESETDESEEEANSDEDSSPPKKSKPVPKSRQPPARLAPKSKNLEQPAQLSKSVQALKPEQAKRSKNPVRLAKAPITALSTGKDVSAEDGPEDGDKSPSDLPDKANCESRCRESSPNVDPADLEASQQRREENIAAMLGGR